MDLSNNPDIRWVDFRNNRLTGIDLSNNINLEHVCIRENDIPSLDYVTGWEKVGLVLCDTLRFDPQRPISGATAAMSFGLELDLGSQYHEFDFTFPIPDFSDIPGKHFCTTNMPEFPELGF
ncbi:MAG: hypothetical protein FWE27_03840 [Defluviitaleaceae bacterium]|nr:hypothetical protein [Defluviitaleaceae bacterium]